MGIFDEFVIQMPMNVVRLPKGLYFSNLKSHHLLIPREQHLASCDVPGNYCVRFVSRKQAANYTVCCELSRERVIRVQRLYPKPNTVTMKDTCFRREQKTMSDMLICTFLKQKRRVYLKGSKIKTHPECKLN